MARANRHYIPGHIWHTTYRLFVALGAEVIEREGSRVAVVLFNEVRVFHRPHPTPDAEIATRAAAAGKSLNQWVADMLDQIVHTH